MPSLTAFDRLQIPAIRAEERARAAAREQRIAREMPRALAFATAVIGGIECYACEDVRECVEVLAQDAEVERGIAAIAEVLIEMDTEQDEGWTCASAPWALLYALWQVGILAEEPESDVLGHVRWDGFGPEASIRAAVRS